MHQILILLQYGNGKKAYISTIIDRFDLSIISYVISKRNDNKIVMDTIKKDFEIDPSAHPIIHSDRGFQYTFREYKNLKEKYWFKVNMSPVSKCLDNQPIESFWGRLNLNIIIEKHFKASRN